MDTIFFCGGAAPLEFAGAKFGAILDNLRLWSRIAPKRRKISKIGKASDQLQPLPRSATNILCTVVH